MAINIDMSGYAQVRPIITAGSANAIGASTGVSINSPGDIFVDTDVGIMSVWNGTAWDDIGPLGNLQMTKMILVEPQSVSHPCPYCGMLNPPDTIECGAGRWNGCGASLREQ